MDSDTKRGVYKKYDVKRTDGPFPPDDAVTDGMPEPGCDWLKLDFRTQPNVLRCLRCGCSQTLPERATPSVFQAIHVAFGEAHNDCQEGDAERLARGAKR